MEEGNEYEAARQRRIAANKAKLASLQMTDAVEDVANMVQKQRKEELAAKQAKRNRAVAALQPLKRRTTSRAAAASARSKLKLQSDDEADEPSTADEATCDPYSGTEGSSGRSSDGSDASLQPSDDDGTEGRRRGRAGAIPPSSAGARFNSGRRAVQQLDGAGTGGGDDDPDLQRALALSMGSAAEDVMVDAKAALAAGAPTEQSAASTDARHSGRKKQRAAAGQQAGSGGTRSQGGAPSRGGRRQPCSGGAGASARLPTEAEVQAMYRLFNPQGMSAIIASDIKQVASETLFIEYEQDQLENMMVRACEVIGLDKQRLDPEAFLSLARRYCG